MALDSQINKVRSNPSLDSQKESTFKRVEDSKEIKRAAVGKEALAEAVDYDESVETTGRVSEVIKDQSEQKGGSVTGSGVTPIDSETIRADLLKNIPTEKEMKKQIESEIKKEIKYLHKKAVKLMAVPNSMSFFEMTNLMKKIRELKGLLVELLKASLDNLKTLWLRFVHGVM